MSLERRGLQLVPDEKRAIDQYLVIAKTVPNLTSWVKFNEKGVPMKFSIALTTALVAGLAVPAMAQDTGAPAAAVAPQAAATSFSDAELVGFANAAIEADKIQKDATIAAEEKQTQMLAAVQAQGLEPARYNEIAQATRTDPELVKKIQELAAASLAANQSSTTATP